MSTLYFRFSARAPNSPARAPLLERLLARADGVPVADWREEAFRVIAPAGAALPAVAAAALAAVTAAAPAAGGATGASVLVATPVHFEAGMSSVGLPPDGLLRLEPAELDALVADFNRVFAESGMRLMRGGGGLLCLFDAPLRAETSPPEAAAGRDLWPFMPRGTDAARLRRHMTEIEMWLFEHAVNERRRALGAPAISGLWLWGAGATGLALPAVTGWTAGEDPLFMAFGRRAQFPAEPASGVVVVTESPGSPEWRAVEQRWLAPASAALRAGRLGRLKLSAADRGFELNARAHWRLWRRPRPWWELLQREEA